jgi:hypothetical protein
MTDDTITSQEQLDELIRSTIREERQAQTATTEASPKPDEMQQPGPPKAAPIETSDHQIGVSLIVEAAGGDREAAFDALASDPQAIERLAPQIAERREQLQTQADAAATKAWERSPEGRRVQAEAVAKQNAEQAQLAGQARQLLAAEGQTPGDVLDSITDAEAIELAGLAEKPADTSYEAPKQTDAEAAATELRSRWWQLAPHARASFADEHGISGETFNAIESDAAAQVADGTGRVWQ